MQELNRVFSIIKSYVQKAHSKGFVSFESISTNAGVTREVLKEHLEKLQKMKMITRDREFWSCFRNQTMLKLTKPPFSYTLQYRRNQFCNCF